MSTPQMLLQILLHTPRWVFVVFALLLVLGLSQLMRREAGLVRVSLTPLGMLAWSFSSMVAAFAAVPLASAAWLAGAGFVAAAVARLPLPAGAGYNTATRRFSVPGSAWPLALMMGIFFTKYAANVAFALQPGLAASASVALPLSALYGAMSGVFLGRALRLWRLWWAARAARDLFSVA